MIIANGRLEKGRYSFFSLHRDVRKSVIDYLIVSESVLNSELLHKFEFCAPATYTDHVPMVIELKIERKNKRNLPRKQKEKGLKNKKFPYKWTEGNKNSFDNDKFKHECNKLNDQLKKEHLTNNDILQKLINIKDNALQSVGGEKPKIIKFSEEIRRYRQYYKKLVKCWKESGIQEQLIDVLKAKRKLNKKIKTERRRDKAKRLFELKKAKDENDHKKYWQLINKTKLKKQKIKSTLEAEDIKLLLLNRDTKQTKIIQEMATYEDKHLIKRIQKSKKADDNLNAEITIEEISLALKAKQNSKSGGPDGFVNEIFKINMQETTPILIKLFNNILNDEAIPWNISWIVPLYKNGDKNNLSSYRCINLSSCIEKLLTKIIKNRLVIFCDNARIISPLQIGFRKDNSVLDNVYILREIMKIYKNRKQELYLCFLDLSKAFDSIPLCKLKQKLRKLFPKSKILSLIIKLLDNKKYEVLYKGRRTEPFELKNGIPQGDSMSPILFNLYINDLLDRFKENENDIDPVIIETTRISILIYADDILLLSRSKKGIIKQIKTVQNYCRDNALKINYSKTKIMIRNGRSKYTNLKISSDGEIKTIDVVEEYKYLGMWITKNNRKHLDNLEKNGRKSSYITAKMLKEFGNINGNMLRDTFEMLTLSKMKYMYCGEFCFDANLKTLNQIQYQFYKRFCHLKITTPNYCLIGEFGIKPVEYHYYKAALSYWVKIITSDEKSLIRKTYEQIYNNLDEKNFTKTWVWNIKKLLYKLKLEDFWTQQDDAKRTTWKLHINKRITEYFREEWINSAKHSHKGNNYLELARFEPHLKDYLNFVVKDKSVGYMLKIRTGNHTLAVEIDRYKNRKTYEECICKSCKQQEIEDLYHVIVKCQGYNELRQKTLASIGIIDIDKAEFCAKMNNLNIKQLKLISQFVKEVEEIRLKTS